MSTKDILVVNSYRDMMKLLRNGKLLYYTENWTLNHPKATYPIVLMDFKDGLYSGVRTGIDAEEAINNDFYNPAYYNSTSVKDLLKLNK